MKFLKLTVAMLLVVSFCQAGLVEDVNALVQELTKSADPLLKPLLEQVINLQSQLTNFTRNATQITTANVQALIAQLGVIQGTITQLTNKTLTQTQLLALSTLNQTLSGVTGFVNQTLAEVNNTLSGTIDTALQSISTAVTGVTGAITTITEAAAARGREVLRTVMGLVQNILKAAGTTTARGADAVAAAATNLLGILGPIVNGTAELSNTTLTQLVNGVIDLFGAVEKASGTVQKAVSGPMAAFLKSGNGFMSAVGAIFGNGVTMFSETFGRLMNSLRSAMERFVGVFAKLLDDLMGIPCWLFPMLCGNRG